MVVVVVAAVVLAKVVGLVVVLVLRLVVPTGLVVVLASVRLRRWLLRVLGVSGGIRGAT